MKIADINASSAVAKRRIRRRSRSRVSGVGVTETALNGDTRSADALPAMPKSQPLVVGDRAASSA